MEVRLCYEIELECLNCRRDVVNRAHHELMSIRIPYNLSGYIEHCVQPKLSIGILCPTAPSQQSASVWHYRGQAFMNSSCMPGPYGHDFTALQFVSEALHLDFMAVRTYVRTSLLQPLYTHINKPFKIYLRDLTDEYIEERTEQCHRVHLSLNTGLSETSGL